MDTRKRAICSAPAKGREYSTKQELGERNSFPLCPPLIAKKKGLQKILFPEINPPRTVFFTKPVTLSRLYNPDKVMPYFDQIFVKYQIIGEGSFGVVFKVRSREDDSIYAIKQLKSSHTRQYGYAEIKNYEKIGDHSNFVKFYMAWEEQKIIYIQMEYCQLSLAQYASITHNVVEAQLWEILYDILKALDHLHTKNFIHLDVKPGNILISKHGFYKLADFGLLVDLNGHDGKKISTVSDGDAKYLACEVLDGVYTYSCDIFGLGISLLELATNIELPEFGPLWHQIRKEFLPSSFYKGVTRQFSIIIEKMMAVEHCDRPQASKILKYSALKKIHNKDLKLPRKDYCQNLPEIPPHIRNDEVMESNNNIIDTPRRPLCEVRTALSSAECNTSCSSNDSCRELVENGSPGMGNQRRGIFRMKLTF